MTRPTITSLDEIPTVCLEADLAAIFRLSKADVRFWRRFPESLPFPPLPWLDRQLRVSGCVVAWFLAQEAREYHRSFYEPLRERGDVNRRKRIPWWRFTAPHDPRFWAKPFDNEQPTVSVAGLAEILRASPGAIRRAVVGPEFPMPPALARPMRWTEGQVERLLWAPPDHQLAPQRRSKNAPRNTAHLL